MGGSSRQSDASVCRAAGALVDQGVVSKYFHGFDGSGEAGGNIRGNLYRRDYRAVVVGSGDGDAARAGEGGGQIVGGVPMLEEGDGAGRYEKDEAENDVLDETAL